MDLQMDLAGLILPVLAYCLCTHNGERHFPRRARPPSAAFLVLSSIPDENIGDGIFVGSILPGEQHLHRRIRLYVQLVSVKGTEQVDRVDDRLLGRRHGRGR